MKKIFFTLVAALVAMTMNAMTFDEFMQEVKTVEGGEYVNIPAAAIPADVKAEKLELMIFENPSEDVAVRLNELRSQITRTDDMLVVKENEGNEDFVIYIQTVGEKMNLLVAGLEGGSDKSNYVVVSIMVGDKALLENPDFFKMLKE